MLLKVQGLGFWLNPLPNIKHPTLLIFNTPIMWYIVLYWEYLILGRRGGGLILGEGLRVRRDLKIEDAGCRSKRFRVLRRSVSAF